jgi:hypothetical protein
VQILRMRPGEEHAARAHDVIQRQLTYLTRLVDDLLDVSRITRGKITLAPETVGVATLIERAVETVQPLLAERHHELLVEIADRTLGVYGDPLRLVQALGNVLGNAAKYTHHGGRITVTAGRAGPDVEIHVRDNGVGIPPERQSTIFDLFAQANRGAEDPQGGLGIGLALVRRLVEMHGGSVAAYSAGAGLGSEFVLRLPLAARHRAIDEPAQRPLERPAGIRRRVLIADDNADTLETLGTVLKLFGHQVFLTANGKLALEGAARHRPDVALLDGEEHEGGRAPRPHCATQISSGLMSAW